MSGKNKDMAESPGTPFDFETAERLGRLVEVASQSNDWSSLKTLLANIAVTLRDADSRPLLGRTKLPECLVAILHRADVSRPTVIPEGEFEGCVEEVGRVAANLAADCDDNRDRLSSLGYPSAATITLQGIARDSSTTRRSLLASLLNLTIAGHAQSLEDLSQGTAILGLLEQVNLGDLSATQEDQDCATWALEIILQVLHHDSKSLALETNEDLFERLLKPLNLLSQLSLQDEADNPPSLLLKRILISLVLLEKMLSQNEASTAELALDAPSDGSDEDNPPQNISIITLMKAFSASVHLLSKMGSPMQEPASGDSDSDEEETDRPSNLEIVKAIRSTLAKVLVDLCSFLRRDVPRHEPVWTTLLAWLRSPESDDTFGCAVLCLGNTLHNDTDAARLLSELEPTLPLLIQQLSANTTAPTRHAAIGLLRNLSVAPANRAKLGELDLIGALVQYAVFDDEQNDMLGSVQGGAVVTLKNLCRDCSPNARQFAQNELLCSQLVSLAKRTDDPALRMEISRSFVSVLRTLSLGEAKEMPSTSIEQYTDIAALLSRTLCEENVPSLVVHEAVLGLLLLAASGDQQRIEAIASELHRSYTNDPKSQPSSQSGSSQLEKIAQGEGQLDEAVRKNAQALLHRLGIKASEPEGIAT